MCYLNKTAYATQVALSRDRVSLAIESLFTGYMNKGKVHNYIGLLFLPWCDP